VNSDEYPFLSVPMYLDSLPDWLVVDALQSAIKWVKLAPDGTVEPLDDHGTLECIADHAVTVTEPQSTPAHMLYHRLAVLTLAMIDHNDPAIVKDWMLARGELLCEQLSFVAAGERDSSE
jgi:hypothetical protein